jgi:hypothetical protein
MKRPLALLISLVLIVSAGCTYRSQAGSSSSMAKGKSADDEAGPESVPISHWFYFSDAGIHAAATPQEIPARTFRPWTEAIRVSDASTISGEPALLINRLGIMTTGNGSGAPSLHTAPLFPACTAGGIYRSGNDTLVRLYRNSFFSDAKAPAPSGEGVCLVRFDGKLGTFAPTLSAASFGLASSAQCVALDRVGSMWYASFKDESAGKVDFAYLEFPALPEGSRETATGIVDGMRRISSEDYQKSVAPFAFKDAPEALAQLLAGIPAGTAFTVKFHSLALESAQTFIKDGDGTPVNGTAFASDEESAALFADGTFYFRPGKTDGAVSVLQLPALARGYVYTDFVMIGRKLLAAWEEQRFFETGRAGLLEISIPDEVY